MTNKKIVFMVSESRLYERELEVGGVDYKVKGWCFIAVLYRANEIVDVKVMSLN
jgi:hypothetical protein